MIVEELVLRNYRNHQYASFDFSQGLNVIVGENATGKTNLIESIDYLSRGHSFKNCETKDLVCHGSEQAKIECRVKEGEIERKILAILQQEGHAILINSKPIKKLSELSKCVNVILFEPKDVNLFRGSPKERRNFIDVSISKKSSNYFEYLCDYEKLLKERNEILKLEPVNFDLLDATTDLLIKNEYHIVKYRQQYTEDINDILNKITRALTGTHEKFELHYYPFIKCNSEFESNAKIAYKKALDVDLLKRSTSIGVHREDLSMSLNNRDIGEFGSQGENRIASLALKLAPYFLIEDKDKRPIVILDDVMSELDTNHQKNLIEFLKRFEQVFITTTKLKVDGAKYFQIKRKDKGVL